MHLADSFSQSYNSSLKKGDAIKFSITDTKIVCPHFSKWAVMTNKKNIYA